MQYAARLPSVPSTKTVAVPLVALVLGAAAATGAYALIDDGTIDLQPSTSKVIVVDKPAQPAQGVAVKHEAATAAAIAVNPVGQGVAAKDEAGTAAAIAGNPVGQGTAAKDEAGTAAAIGGVSAPGEGVTAKDEAGTAAAIGGASAPDEGVTAKDEAGTAAAISGR
jgi:hypothetical protein